MGNNVIISCDSSADLSPALLRKFNIPVNAAPILVDDEVRKDMEDITPFDIFEYVEKTKKVVKTSAPNVAEYVEFFRPLVTEGNEIIHFTISSLMSAGYNNCRLASEEFEGVYAIDSKNLSTGIGLLVLHAVKMRDAGKSAIEIVTEIEELRDRVDASFILDTLEYMRKGGRCSSVAALGANLLQLKPCIEVKNGAMGVGRKYRGKQAMVLDEYVRARLSDVEDIVPDTIFITHSHTPQDVVDVVRERIQSLIPFSNIYETYAGCTVSVHCGPNTLGILFIRRTPLTKNTAK
ncbi:MAG: DegV family protein [Lachnospiraceae bacterium]|jgi:DegV family protein with EDD domain|nr:DegV family protein [Lachnospiraceae bacterium]